MLKRIQYLFGLLCFVGLCNGQEGTWKHGAVFVDPSSDVMSLGVAGVTDASDAEAMSGFYSGAIRLQSNVAGTAWVLASSGLKLGFSGPGAMAIERFEHYFAAEGGRKTSRMIVSLMDGEVVLDARELASGDRLQVEMPVGKLTVRAGALCLASIRYDDKNQVYDFEVDCFSGSVQMNTYAEEKYVMYAGRKLNGVGPPRLTSVEVVEFVDAEDELAEELQVNLAGLAPGVDLDAGFAPKMVKIERDFEQVEMLQADSRLESLMIEYVPAPKPVIKRKGVLPGLGQQELQSF